MAEAGLSQNRLEQEAGLSAGYISRIFSGERGKSIDTEILRALSDVLGVTTDWLVKGFSGKDPYPNRAIVVRIARVKKMPPEVIERLYGDRYQGRPDLSKESWMKALEREHHEYLRAGVEELKVGRAAKTAKDAPGSTRAPAKRKAASG